MRPPGGDRYYNNITADLQVSDVAPWAHELFMKRQLEFGKDSMETLCLPLGPAYLTARYREFRIGQTPIPIQPGWDTRSADGRNHFVHVTQEGPNLWFDYDGKGKELLVALSPARFSWTGSIVEFSSAGEGATITIHYVESTELGSRRK